MPAFGNLRHFQHGLDVIALWRTHGATGFIHDTSTPNLEKASTNTPIGANDPKSIVVPAQSKIAALKTDMSFLSLMLRLQRACI
jgi:hypothetical protein